MAEVVEPVREMLIVQSKVRDELRRHDLRISEEFLSAFNDEVRRMVERAAARCLGNRRRTLDRTDV